MRIATFVLVVVHVVVGAVWLGAMAYSLGVVQPRATTFFSAERAREDFFVTLAAGARRPVLAAIGALGLSGAGLALIGPHRPAAWWILVALKALVLLAVLILFARVSWRLWPRRLFATDAELPALRVSFRRTAVALTALVGLGTVLGLAAARLA